jgi:hypothetical protein
LDDTNAKQWEARRKEEIARQQAAQEQCLQDARRTEELRQQWASCEQKKNCDALCYAAGSGLAASYMSNVRSAASNGIVILATEVMEQGCKQNAGFRDRECEMKCHDAFKMDVKSMLKIR